MNVGGGEQVLLDGEPAVVGLVETYEYPARGGQWLAYVMAVHDGRPYVIRLHNRLTNEFHLEEVLEGFQFTN